VYGRFNATLTIHIADCYERPEWPLRIQKHVPFQSMLRENRVMWLGDGQLAVKRLK